MDQPVLQEVRIQGYRCLKDVRLKLTPLHALIGPNDSGKSTILAALHRCALAIVSGHDQTTNGWSVAYTSNKWSVYSRKEKVQILTHVKRLRGDIRTTGPLSEEPALSEEPDYLDITSALKDIQYLALKGSELKKPGYLLDEKDPIPLGRLDSIASSYDVLLNRNVDNFLEIQKKVKNLFPSIERIGFFNQGHQKVMSATLKDGTRIRADEMSEGLLYYLAYAALPYLHPASVLLLEEPENGLHPARIREVMRILRELSKTTQILLTTHSPMVIDELAPEEVTIITRDPEKGTQATPMKDTPNFEARQKVYTLGALWLSYADGDLEAPLLQGGPRLDP